MSDLWFNNLFIMYELNLWNLSTLEFKKSDLSCDLKNRKKSLHFDVSIFISINPVFVKHRVSMGNATAGPIFLCGPYAAERSKIGSVYFS